MHENRITVLMPAFNAEKYISQSIQSVLDQTFKEFELLIINDGSTDNTEEVVKSFKDPRIRYTSQENKGVSSALNLGLSMAETKYIARFDADDICYPYRLAMQYWFMECNPAYIITGSEADYMDMEGNFVFSFHPPAYNNCQIQSLPYLSCPFVHSSVMYRSEAVKSLGYDLHAHSFEDHFLWRKLLKLGNGLNFNIPLIKVRLSPESITIDETWRSNEFRNLKYGALRSEKITAGEGQRLLELIQQQKNNNLRKGSYYSLLGKKFLWDNHRPVQARKNLLASLKLYPLLLINYFLFIISFLPQNLIKKIYFFSQSAKWKYNVQK